MIAGQTGTFVISWAKTQLDGDWNAPPAGLAVGAAWSCAGDACGWTALRARRPLLPKPTAPPICAAVRPFRCAGCCVRRSPIWSPIWSRILCRPPTSRRSKRGFTVTDGHASWIVTLIDAGPHRVPLAMVLGNLPPWQTELWVVSYTIDLTARATVGGQTGGVICFTPGTMIMTDSGPRPVQDLAEGDKVQTKDNGPAPILWIGRRRVSGARIHAMPHLAPIRLRQGALDQGVPDAGLLVSPDHRLILRGPRALAPFNTAEVLVTARNLVNDRSVVIDRSVPERTYIHLLLPRHEIVFADAVETESFHPASAALATMEDDQLLALLRYLPAVADDPLSYGPFARRMLSQSEAAILGHDMAA